MNQTAAIWLLIAIALIAANLPFINERLFGLIPLGSMRPETTESGTAPAGQKDKSFWLRLIEIIVLYGLTGLLGYLFESAIGNPFKQRWEFYAITFSLFIVLAFPGFVVRYLMRRA